MSDTKIGQLCSEGQICLSQTCMITTKLDNMKSYYQLIIKITISEERRRAMV